MLQTDFLKSLVANKKANYDLTNPCTVKDYLLQVYDKMGLLKDLFNLKSVEIIKSDNLFLPNKVLMHVVPRTTVF